MNVLEIIQSFTGLVNKLPKKKKKHGFRWISVPTAKDLSWKLLPFEQKNEVN